MKLTAAGVCFVVLIRIKSAMTQAAHHPAGVAASLAFIRRGFVILAGTIVRDERARD